MLCASRPPTILGDFYRTPEKSHKSSVDNMCRACGSKDQTLKKIRTLHSPDLCDTLICNISRHSCAIRLPHRNKHKPKLSCDVKRIAAGPLSLASSNPLDIAPLAASRSSHRSVPHAGGPCRGCKFGRVCSC